jgi:ring-1,2-phenylacetyl-CoA epoxidase subunit PaaC
MNKQAALFQYCLRLGDDAVILGHRLSEWCSQAPILEEDLALTNFALDYIGRAEDVFEYAASLEGKGRSGDDLVYRRPERQYYNHLITEQPNGDFAQTIARQFLFSSFDCLHLEELTRSQDATLAGIAAKGIKEAKYHLRHATDWVFRLGDGTPESHSRMQAALDKLWMFTGELFEMDDIDLMLLEAGIACDLHTIKPVWQKQVAQVIAGATLQLPADGYMQTGSRQGVHTEYLGHILSEMQYLVRAYPDATW